jgi:hypothetical protein
MITFGRGFIDIATGSQCHLLPKTSPPQSRRLFSECSLIMLSLVSSLSKIELSGS